MNESKHINEIELITKLNKLIIKSLKVINNL